MADGEGPSVERDAWMSEQVAGEIEELRRRFGFERKEAVAYWHLRHAHQLMSEMGQTDHFKELDREGRSELEADFREFAGLIHDISVLGESRVFQHFAAPYRELGTRVLRRNYPDGWARLTAARMKTAKEATARRSWWRKLRLYVACLVAQGVRFVVGPQDPKDITRDTARRLSALVGELAAERYSRNDGAKRNPAGQAFEGLSAPIIFP